MSADATTAAGEGAGAWSKSIAGGSAGPKSVVGGSGLSESKLGFVLVTPAIVLMLLVAAYPMLDALWLSLHRYNIKVPQDFAFIGLGNYTRILASGHWWQSVATTMTFTIGSVGIEFVLGMAMALVMNKAFGAWTGVIRVAVLVPWATITVVTALAWKWLFTPGQTMNVIEVMVRPFVGQDACVLCGHWSSMSAMIFADVWKTAPFIALLLLAGLQSIDAEMYEAADVDGATWTQKFVGITLPCLKPAILVALLFRTLDAMRMFDLAYLMTGGANATDTVSVLGYQHLIKGLDMGLGSALAMLIFLMVLGVAFFFTRVLGAQTNEAT